MASRIVVVTGASGAGKTTVVKMLAERSIDGVVCAFFDSVGVPPPEEMPADWQEKTTIEWIRRLARGPADIAVLDGQTKPTFALRAFTEQASKGASSSSIAHARHVKRGSRHADNPSSPRTTCTLGRRTSAVKLMRWSVGDRHLGARRRASDKCRGRACDRQIAPMAATDVEPRVLALRRSTTRDRSRSPTLI